MSEHGELQRSNRALLVRLCVVVLAMFGFGFALVLSALSVWVWLGRRGIDEPRER